MDRMRLLTEQEVSHLTGIPVSTLQTDRFKRQNLPYIKIGRRVRYRLGDVLDYIENHRVQFESPPHNNGKAGRKLS